MLGLPPRPRKCKPPEDPDATPCTPTPAARDEEAGRFFRNGLESARSRAASNPLALHLGNRGGIVLPHAALTHDHDIDRLGRHMARSVRFPIRLFGLGLLSPSSCGDQEDSHTNSYGTKRHVQCP